MKVLLTNNPLAPSNQAPSDFRVLQHQRPAWIRGDQAGSFPGVIAFRLQFDVSQDAKIRVHISADERYLCMSMGYTLDVARKEGQIGCGFTKLMILT